MAKLGDVCVQITDGSHNPPKGIDISPFMMLSSKNIDDDKINFDNPRYLNKEDFEKENKRTAIKENDLLMTIVGTVGRVACVSKDMDNICFQRSVAVLKPDESIIDSRFLMYHLQYLRTYLEHESRGVAQKGIYLKQLSELDINLPVLSTQKNIVRVLDGISNLIVRRHSQLKKLDELVKSRFIEMFDSVGEFCEVGHYIKSLIAGKSLAGEAECENKVLKTGAASFDYFDVSQVKNLPLDYEPKLEHLVSVGDIIISRMNTAELTGAAAYVWDVPENIYVPDRLWKAVLTENSNPIFVWQMLIQPSTKEQIQRECSGTSGSMKNISKAGLLGIKVKKVSLDLQNQFADFVAQVDKSKLAVQKSLDQLEILKKSLMQEYFG